MQHKTRFWVAVLAVLGWGAVSTPASAQDYPTHKGDNQRVGRNGDPFGSNPGLANLRWWHPDITEGAGSSSLRDNTSSLTTVVGAWVAAVTGKEASFPLIPTQTGNVTEDPKISSFFDPASPNFGLRPIVPAYMYARTVASRFQADPAAYDPTVAALGTAASFTWNLTPSDPTPRNYAVYVWVPAGPTDTSATNVPQFLFPQRYFVYAVNFGAGQRFTDVVDTSVSGTGWVRIGNGGKPTDKMFPYSGVGTLSVSAYNTIPRDASGNLLITPGQPVTLMYADAAMASPVYGSYSASPVVAMLTGGLVTSVVGALNHFDLGLVDGTYRTTSKGIVSSYAAANGARRWSFTPLNESELAINLDAPSPLVVANPPAWANSTTATGFMGSGYFAANLVSTVGAATDVVYSPKLASGDFDVYVWLAGSNNGQLFATQLAFEIHEGATVSTVYVDEDAQKGWVRLGTRRYQNTTAAPLSVHALNFSNNPGDILAGRLAYADAMKFVGAANLNVTSTPVMVNGALIKLDTTANPPVATDVTIVAAENGRIYCLDSVGNADGTTNVYWTYPSTPDKTNPAWTDPNQVAGQDGPGGIAEMPTNFGFDLSSALVERIGGRDLLYIAAKNGRVYCIDVAGRGDMNLALRKPGTTTRVWSYPDDYPASPKPSNLGDFTGSVVFANNAGGPTIFVPAPQGRIYALNAVGNVGNKTTTVRWQYPAATAPTLGTIVMTPAIEFGKVYFGTQASDAGRGEFYALNMDTGAVVWKFDGTAAVAADDFSSSPCTVPTALFNKPGFPQTDTVFAANDNRFIYALDANGNGDGTTNVLWSTDELSTTVSAALSFVPLRVFANTTVLTGTPVPILMVPTADGRMDGLFADGSVNRFGTKRAYEFVTGGSLTASVGNGRTWMYSANTDGMFFAFNNDAGAPISPGSPPGQPTIPENDASGDVFRNAIIKFVDKPTYDALRAGTMTYAQAVAAPIIPGNPPAFEWGQTMYCLVFNFPYAVRTPNNSLVPPPVVNYAFSVEGSSVRNLSVESRQFPLVAPGNPPVSPVDNTTLLDGYTVLAFALQTGGGTSLAPGSGQMTATITTGSLNNNGARQNVALSPQSSRVLFNIANPLSLLMNGTGDLLRSIGYTINAYDPEALENGSRDLGTPNKRQSLLFASAGLVAHGQSGATVMGVVDRSLMTLLRGPGRGLEAVRWDRRDLFWQGGPGAVFKPLDPILYPGFEDMPNHFPNDSLDYPDVGRDAISVVKDQFGNAENPLFSGVSLLPPTFTDPSNPDPATRTLVVTPFNITVAVPRFQPPNSTLTLDSALATIPAGYHSRQIVFVDSNGDGTFQRGGGRRNAFRSLNLATNVDVDLKLRVTTPTVDAGSLPEGTGFSPAPPWDTVNNPLSPLAGPWQYLFQKFVLDNPGNVNLRNVRLAKRTQYEPNAPTPWPIFSPANHELTWLETQINVFASTDNDPRWLVTDDNGNQHHYVVLQKPRVGDRVPTELSINPIRRANAGLGVDQGLLASAGPYPYPPSVAVTVPIGMPVGTYAQTMRMIDEDTTYAINEALSLDQYGNGLEPYSDPTFVLRFNVRESRLTNTFTKGTAPMVDNLVAGNERFLHNNLQPTMLRDPIGNMAMAWSSTRSSFTAPEPGANLPLTNPWRIYMASLKGVAPGAVGGTNPLRELNFFSPALINRWFVQSATSPFPTCTSVAEANALFNVNAANGEAMLLDTVAFGSPSFPVLGFTDPMSGATLSNPYMGFVGEGQLQTPTGRATISRLFLAPLTIDSSGAALLGVPVIDTHDDPVVRKTKPSVVQVGQFATLFFSGGAAGQQQLMYATYDPSIGNVPDRWSTIRGLTVGSGFESATSPSVFLRTYQGPAYPDSALVNGQPILEMTFAGKLRGRPNAEAFYGRILANGNGAPAFGGGQARFSYQPLRIQERLVAGGEPGLFRSVGVAWNMRNTVKLEQMLDGVVTNLEITDAGGNPTTRTTNGTTGLMTFDTKLGGKVYVDPSLGTVKFSSAAPAKRAILMLTYQPRFLRISGAAQTAAHSLPAVQFDNRLIGEASFWARVDGTGVRNTDTDAIRPARFVFTYGRAAAGAGQAARPYMKTMRLGLLLPSPVATLANGNVVSLTVTGNTGAYQVDPSKGRIYFTDVDENRTITVNFTGVNEAGQQIVLGPYTNLVTLVPEMAEIPVPIEQAINEAGMTSFLDPFDPGGQIGARRPGLLWLLWMSTRAGAPDLYFETMAPRFTPLPTGN